MRMKRTAMTSRWKRSWPDSQTSIRFSAKVTLRIIKIVTRTMLLKRITILTTRKTKQIQHIPVTLASKLRRLISKNLNP